MDEYYKKIDNVLDETIEKLKPLIQISLQSEEHLNETFKL